MAETRYGLTQSERQALCELYEREVLPALDALLCGGADRSIPQYGWMLHWTISIFLHDLYIVTQRIDQNWNDMSYAEWLKSYQHCVGESARHRDRRQAIIDKLKPKS